MKTLLPLFSQTGTGIHGFSPANFLNSDRIWKRAPFSWGVFRNLSFEFMPDIRERNALRYPAFLFFKKSTGPDQYHFSASPEFQGWLFLFLEVRLCERNQKGRRWEAPEVWAGLPPVPGAARPFGTGSVYPVTGMRGLPFSQKRIHLLGRGRRMYENQIAGTLRQACK